MGVLQVRSYTTVVGRNASHKQDADGLHHLGNHGVPSTIPCVPGIAQSPPWILCVEYIVPVPPVYVQDPRAAFCVCASIFGIGTAKDLIFPKDRRLNVL